MSQIRHLILIRHAKSTHAFPSLEDIERPLAERGLFETPPQAQRLRELLRAAGVLREQTEVLCSPAVRTKCTWDLFKPFFHEWPEARYDGRLYLQGTKAVLESLSDLQSETRVAIVFGHNPEFEEIVLKWTKREAKIAPSGVIALTFECEHWSEISAKKLKLCEALSPRKRELND